MSEIDDETIVKLKAFATGKGKAVGPPKRIKRAAPTAEVAVPAAPPAPVTMRDFFKEEVAAEVAPVPQVEIPVVAPPPVPVAPPAPRLKSIIEDRPAGKKVKLTKTKKEEPKADTAEAVIEPELDVVTEVEAVEEEVAVTERKREVKKDKPPVTAVDTRAKPKDRRSGRRARRQESVQGQRRHSRRQAKSGSGAPPAHHTPDLASRRFRSNRRQGAVHHPVPHGRAGYTCHYQLRCLHR